MEGSRSVRKQVLSVEREFECSRLELELLASAYERVLPGVRVVGDERRRECAATIPPAAVEALSSSVSLAAMGGHLS